MDVWSDLIGQERAVAELKRALAGGPHAMTHAWLITGPPGSGRSNAARAFAAALQCDNGGCGECKSCRTSLAGSHPDVTLVRTETLTIGVDEVRELAMKAAMSPSVGKRQIIVVEDADRITDRGADALLKSLEEPAPRTVWLLCAPSAEDVIVTIRSRCRHLGLVTPSTQAICELLQRRDGIDPKLAEWAARVSGGHVGKARGLALDPQARAWRDEVLELPGKLRSVAACLTLADGIIKKTKERADATSKPLDDKETEALKEALGAGTKGAKPRSLNAALKDLEDQQKLRNKRLQRDAIDQVLIDLTGYYRDVLKVQTGAGGALVNEEQRPAISALAESSNADDTLAKIDALAQCHRSLGFNASPGLAFQALLLTLR
ncbi:MAG: DNA polymerase III subunit delta' [Propionibacteriaceae bacterium]|jgi:DNA polymerase-3 subunit delta'|nr:DNA polymerase III subunit delta' [Propionibacteriaceae bacterium]